MTYFLLVVLVVVMGLIALVASGWGTPMADDYVDRPDATVPAEGDLRADDLRRVRFALGFRGYRMAEVDALLSRLADQLDRAEDARADRPARDDLPAGPAYDGPEEPGRLEKPDGPDQSPSAAERRPDATPPG